FTCDPKGDHGIQTASGNFCSGGKSTGSKRATNLVGWTAGGDDQLNSTTTTITCTTQDRSGFDSVKYGGSAHLSGSPDITFANALGSVCVLTNPVFATLSFDP